MPGSDSEYSLDSETSMMLSSSYFRSAGQPTTTESIERADELVKEMKSNMQPVWVLDQVPQQLLTGSVGFDDESLILHCNPERQMAQRDRPALQPQEIHFHDDYTISRQEMSSGSIFDNVIQMQDGDFNDFDLSAQIPTMGPVSNVRQEAIMNQSSSSDALLDLEVQDRMPTNPRYKTKIACVHCAKNKLGCDLKRPCQRCRDTGKSVTCVDRPHVRRRRPQERHRRTAALPDVNTVEEMERGFAMRQQRTPYSRPEGQQRYHLPTVRSAPAQLDQVDFTTIDFYGARFEP